MSARRAATCCSFQLPPLLFSPVDSAKDVYKSCRGGDRNADGGEGGGGQLSLSSLPLPLLGLVNKLAQGEGEGVGVGADQQADDSTRSNPIR
ncbi:hypothetical protein BaRGS_00003726 [Batillaria attramentaria]|uniref:Uncharacterized protein n=1 Tax=Batillaria attramentaria TaxID=370345 RepID=A0ABD0M1G3_9CAEN